MKSLLTTLILGSFASIAVFGAVGMHAGMQNHDGDCIAATIQGTDCPKQSAPFVDLAFHLGVFKNFSTATFSNIAVSLLILSLFAIGIVFRVLPGNLASPAFAYRRLEKPDPFSPPSQLELLRWLALHENSPATP